ncbi:MAG: hypothetical protein WCA08_21970 [Desulfoferrobacter sp.]
MCKPDRYYRALKRNLHEVRFCLSYRNALNAIAAVSPETSWSFFSYAYLALKNDMVAHAIKVLDKHKDASSFWYLYRCNQRELDSLLKKFGLPYEDIENLTEKLIKIRDKTHFHIDKIKVFNPAAIWKEADIKGTFFNSVMEGIWEVLKEVHISSHSKPFVQPIYDGNDVGAIIEAAKKAGITV